MSAWSTLFAIAVTAVASLFVTLVVLNLSLGNKPIDDRPTRLFSVADPEFERFMGAVLTPTLVPGNQVRALRNGDEVFPAMLDAIRGARKTITLETYIYWSGTIGREVAAALRERANHGVRVHVLLDWFGSDLDDAVFSEMRASGIEVHRYNNPAWYNLGRINHRTHRRLLVVDGRIGFIGGVGFGDKWRGHAQDPQHWRDTHFEVRGPVVAQLQSAFIGNWIQASGDVLHGDGYLPLLESQGTALAHVFTSAPGGGAKNMQLMYLMSITSAAKSIDLSAAYFVPDEVALNALEAALRRGVRLRLILPGRHMDKTIVRLASRATWGRLLAGGAEIYEYQPTMFHCKVMIVDGLWTSVGSTNFDSRSFSINDEANLNVYDAKFAQRQVEIFEDDLAHSTVVTFAQWQGRSWWDKTLDWLASLTGSQL